MDTNTVTETNPLGTQTSSNAHARMRARKGRKRPISSSILVSAPIQAKKRIKRTKSDDVAVSEDAVPPPPPLPLFRPKSVLARFANGILQLLGKTTAYSDEMHAAAGAHLKATASVEYTESSQALADARADLETIKAELRAVDDAQFANLAAESDSERDMAWHDTCQRLLARQRQTRERITTCQEVVHGLERSQLDAWELA
jgi:hypothetical protein